MTRVPSSRTARLSAVFNPAAFDLAIVFLYALFLWAPWDRAATASASSSFSMTWLVLPVTLARHGIHLVSATVTVTIAALVAATLAAFLSIVARMRGSASLWAVGAWLFGCSIAILMPPATAVGFLGALLLIVALRARFVAMRPATALAAVLGELWPIGYAAGFAALAWRYNPQLLIKALLIALGTSLIARALRPSREGGTANANAGSLR
jgi:hypothetical protein